jgi:carboxylesterase
MRPWGDYLANRGYAVELPLLPGHGTRWQDLNSVDWTDWYAEAEQALDRLLSQCDAVVVGALSTGGAVALRLAEERDGDGAGRARLSAASPEGPRGRDHDVAVGRAGPAEGDPAAALRPLQRGPRIDASSIETVLGAVSYRDVAERVLTNSFHVATLDHEAPIIFAESADFVARVAG